MKRTSLRVTRFNFARLNHLFIPETNAQRDRFRRMKVARLLRPLVGIYSAMTREGRSVLLVSILVGAMGLDVARTDAHVLSCVLGSLLAASVVVSRFFRMGDAALEATAPRRVTVGEAISLTVSCRNDGTLARRGLRVSRPFLPWDGAWLSEQPTIAEILPGRRESAVVQARFSHRGEHHLDPFHAGLLVPLRLAVGPQVESGGCKFLVVPKIARVVRVTTPLGVRHQPGGVALASKTGESRDLLGVRPYRPGDPVRDLHARTWARVGEPVVREYQEEYFSRIGVILDTDRSLGDPRQLEAAISLAAGVVARLSRGEALIDLLVVGDDVHSLTLGRSLGFFEQALDLLACVEAGPPPSADALMRRLAPFLPRLSCVVLIALDWDDARRSLAQRVRGFGVGCTVVVVTKDGATMPGAEGVTEVGVDAITRGEALVL
jgi:uncharacterized protein (DUF58 family)